MSKRLFVGGLSWDTDETSLRRAFETYGELDEVQIITDRETGRSRGFGFLTILDDAVAEKAIAEMDGSELDGRTIRVNEAQERAPRGDRFQGGGGDRGGGRRRDNRKRGGGKRNRW